MFTPNSIQKERQKQAYVMIGGMIFCFLMVCVFMLLTNNDMTKQEPLNLSDEKLIKVSEWNDDQINELVSRLIKECKLSQAQIADDLGVSRMQVNQFVNGNRGVSKALLIKILNYFGYKLVPQKITRKEREHLDI